MAAQTLDVFARTVYRDGISPAPEEKAAIAAHILQQAEEPATVTRKLAGMAWPGDKKGDKKGHKFLFRDPLFAYHPLKPENSGDIRISLQEVPKEVVAAITEIAMPQAAP